MRFVQIFAGVYSRGGDAGIEPLNLVIIHIIIIILSDIFEMCGRLYNRLIIIIPAYKYPEV